MVTKRLDARVGHHGAAWPCACAARMDQEKASSRSPDSSGPLLSTSLRARSGARARSVVPPHERACRAKYACARGLGRAGRKWSGGAGEVEGEPRSGTEREGGASASPELTAPALFPLRPAQRRPPPGRSQGAGRRRQGRRMEAGVGLDLWQGHRPHSGRDELRGGRWPRRPGEGCGAPGRNLGGALG